MGVRGMEDSEAAGKHGQSANRQTGKPGIEKSAERLTEDQAENFSDLPADFHVSHCLLIQVGLD